jgi:hypothetical protein
VLDEHVELLERAAIEQKFDALARRQLAARVLRLDALFAPAESKFQVVLTRRFPPRQTGLPPLNRAEWPQRAGERIPLRLERVSRADCPTRVSEPDEPVRRCGVRPGLS